MSASLKLIAKIFDTDFIDVPSELITEEYQRKIYQALSKYYYSTGKKPTKPFFIEKIIPRLSKEDSEKKSLKEIINNLPDVEESSEEIKELLEDSYKKTSLSRLGKEFANHLKKEEFDEVFKIITKMESVRDVGTDDQLDSSNDSFLDDDEAITRVSTGIPGCSNIITTIPESSVILFGAPPKHGKTILSLISITNEFFKGESVAIYSYEMPIVQLKARQLSYLTGVPYEEVETQKFTIEESKLKVKGARYAFVYDISVEKAMELTIKGKESEIEKLPKRKNVIIFRGGLSSKEIRKAKEQGRKIRPLPNNETIIADMKMYYNIYGVTRWLVDYLQIVPVVTKTSREEGLTKLIQDVKEFCIETSSNAYIPVQTETDLNEIKYAKSLKMYCDLYLAIARTAKLDKLKSIGVFVGANRHGPWNFGYIYENKLDCMNIVEVDSEEHSLESLMEK